MVVQIDSVCSSEEGREEYDTMKAEIQRTTSLIKKKEKKTHVTSTGVFASPMLSRKTFASLYMISSFLFIIFKKIKSFISYPHYGLLPRTDTKHTDSTYRSHELSFSYGYELNSSVLCQIPGFLLCETVESDCIFSAPTSHLIKSLESPV